MDTACASRHGASSRGRFRNVMSPASNRNRSPGIYPRAEEDGGRRQDDSRGENLEECNSIYHHPRIGDIKTRKAIDGVRQFLGIQYATLQDRFAFAQIRHYGPEERLDCVRLGSQVLDIPRGPEMEQSLIQHTLPYDKDQLSASDTEGLNLNIWVPTKDHGKVEAGRKLPVFVYIHGGGFHSGSATWPQYDLARFARLSRSLGKPCIAIAFNYRLGAAGLLTSAELRKQGYKANNSLRDQRAALLWIQTYVEGFGGDPCNVTIAGPVSCSYHLQSKQPLFKRAIVMSVTSLQLRPRPQAEAERSYQNAIQSLGLQSCTKEERLRRLLAIDAQELRRKLQGISLAPVIDETMPLEAHTFLDMYDGQVDLDARKWCSGLIIGDCQFDGSIFGLRLVSHKNGIAKTFCSSIRSLFSYTPTVGEKLLRAYDLTPETPSEMAFHKILEMGTDIAFYAPTIAFAEGLHDSMKVFVYRFNEPNPWEGPRKGHATHALDVHFLLQNFNEYMEPKQRKLAEDMAHDFFDFMYGGDPWPEWTCESPTAKMFGPEGKSYIIPDQAGRNGRRGIVWELAQSADMDALLGAFMNALQEAPSKPQSVSAKLSESSLSSPPHKTSVAKTIAEEVTSRSSHKCVSAGTDVQQQLKAVQSFLDELGILLRSRVYSNAPVVKSN